MGTGRKYVVRISSRAYQMAKLAAGLLGEAIEPPIDGADEPGGRVTVTIGKKPYEAAQLVASILSEPVADIVDRMLVVHAQHVIGSLLGPVRIPPDPEGN
jgi:hypothetical protein